MVKQPKAIDGKPTSNAKQPRSAHLELMEQVRGTLTSQYQEALTQGLPIRMVCGFVFDLTDSVVPLMIRESPAAKQALSKNRPGMAAVQTGVVVRETLLNHLRLLAFKLEGREPPLLVCKDQTEPALITGLREFNMDGMLPVVVIYQRSLSVLALPVTMVVQVHGPLPPAPKL
jgi:hypothetical protein